MHIRVMSENVHKLANEKGWYDRERSVPEMLCLIHSEVSEALEGYRNATGFGESGSLGEELADVCIRVFDMAEYLGIDIEAEILTKHEKNKGRPYRHGGKLI